MSSKPHIVIFNPDQWRGDALGHMGHPAVQTPNLDRLAREDGVSFRHAYCQNPVCTPSRCSFMSGWYPHVRGHRSMVRMLHQPEEHCLLSTLKNAGYYVWWGGKNDLIPAQEGFDSVCDVKYSSGYHAIHDPNVPQPKPLYATDKAAEWRGDPDGDNFYSFYVGEIDKGDAEYYRDYDWACVEGALDAIRNAPADQPLCLFLALAYPHPPYGVEQPWYGLTDRDACPKRAPGPEQWKGKTQFMNQYHERLRCGDWSDARWRELQGVYFDMCARVDHQVGLIIEALKKKQMYDDTAFFFFPDHGDYAGDYELVEKHSTCFEDCLTRVPFIIKPPAGTPVTPGIRDSLMELVDFPATVEELTGIRMPEVHFGRSLLPVLADPAAPHREHVLCEAGKLKAEHDRTPGEMKGELPDKNGQYWAKQSTAYDDYRNIGKAFMLRTATHKLIKRLYEPDELYDLQADPFEVRSVHDDPAYADILADLERRLFDTMLNTSDIIPSGFDKRE
ncbi:MAG: sulfatase-like hydrolase/transferase [Verrucomicrobiota bacterium]